jgi:hypothetical protein
MKNYRPIYRDIKDWAVLDEQVIHDFSEAENPIIVVEVLIGTLHYETVDFNQHYEEKRTPIIRWISKKQYEILKQNEGTVIW